MYHRGVFKHFSRVMPSLRQASLFFKRIVHCVTTHKFSGVHYTNCIVYWLLNIFLVNTLERIVTTTVLLYKSVTVTWLQLTACVGEYLHRLLDVKYKNKYNNNEIKNIWFVIDSTKYLYFLYLCSFLKIKLIFYDAAETDCWGTQI